MPANRYLSFNQYLQSRFGYRVQKIPVDVGFSCPNRDGTLSRNGCIFCDSLGSGTGAWSRGESLGQQISTGMEQQRRRYGARGFLVYFQAFTNTYAPVERLRQLYEEALRFPDVVGISIGTRPDCLGDEVLDLVEEIAHRSMVWIELGLQSAHEATLRRINRGHDFLCFENAVRETARRGILACVHLIVGLPGEGPEQIRETAHRIATLPLHGIKIHSLYVARGTTLEKMFLRGEYRTWTREAYVDSVCDILERIPPHWVVQRLTGDPPKGELVAPSWSLEKGKTMKAIQQRLEARDTWQGKTLGTPSPS